MYLRDLSNGKISGTGTIDISTFGTKSVKVLISTDGTNAAAVVIRKNDGAGQKLIDISTKTPGDFPAQPVLVDNTNVIYYDVTGTGASAQIFGCIV